MASLENPSMFVSKSPLETSKNLVVRKSFAAYP